MSAKKTGVIGHPIGHSLSPRIHQYWLKKHGIAGSYEAIDVAPDDAHDFIRRLGAEGFAGVNVTLPLKETAMKAVDEVHLEAAAIGAVNTIVVEDGRLFGYNTDAQGFIANIQETIDDADFFEKTAVVLGAGGAARAVCVALIEEGAQLVISNRTRERAEALRAHLVDAMRENYPEISGRDAIRIVDWDAKEAALKNAALLVNSTSLGMKGQPELAINLATLAADAVVNDIVYNPLETRLLAQARAQGNPTVDGLGMLLYQAAPAFYAWYGVRPEVTRELRHEVIKGLAV